MKVNPRNQLLDFYKGVAIVTVILYHAGLFTYGYLGVEIFLVIGGYLITKSIMHSYEEGHFCYWDYLCKRLVRLWPLALIISIVSLAIGYFTMLPDAYKNTCETAVGTSTFTNNFIQYITAGNYWDTANEYKPLMHTWYLGVIFQFYVLYPLIFMFCHRFTKDYVRASRIVLLIVLVLSLAFFVYPDVDTAVTFYLLPARLFEFAVGGLIALFPKNLKPEKQEQGIMAAILFLMVILLCLNDTFNMAKVRLLLTVIISAFVVIISQKDYLKNHFKVLSIFVPIGLASYSFYLWHQVILAFYRYIINNEFTVWSYLLTIGVSLVVGYLSYLFLEQTVATFTKRNKKRTYVVLVICILMTGIISTFSVKYYKTQGVVRDIPELEVYMDDPNSWAPQEYNARITELYEKDSPPRNGKKNVLVVGDSYARDWMNILLESQIDNINLVYSKDIAKDLRKKIACADIIFLANHGSADIYIDYLPAMMTKKFYRVGDKSFGRSNGIIYNHPRDGEYYHLTIPYEPLPVDEAERIEFNGLYINMMDSIRNADGSISMFTRDNKLITHDGLHLTRAGARRYAELIDVKRLVK